MKSTCLRSLLLLLLCSLHAPAQTILHREGLQQDVRILRQAYETLHPGLYRYNTKPQMDAAFQALSLRLDRDVPLAEAFLAFSEFAAKVRCGHTQANPFNQSKAVLAELFQKSPRVPFYFRWLNRRMIVTEDFTAAHTLPAGTEILSINGVPVQAILARLLPIARADGGNDSKRIAQLAVTGDSEYETFDLYYPLFFPVPSGNMQLLVRTPGARKPTRLPVTPLTWQQRIAPLQKSEAARRGGSDPIFTARTLPGGAVVLQMPTWALYDSKWDWKTWVNETVDNAAANGAPVLILDLRGNEGGQDVGNEILTHLIDTPLSLSAMRRLVRYRSVPANLVPYLDTWDKSFRDWGAQAIPLAAPWPTAPAEVPYLRLTRFDDNASGDVIQPAGKRFRGKVFVLIDANNSSATFQFAQAVQAHHMGTLIGQTTGGSQRGINGGAFFFLRLPNSGIEMDLPLIGTFPPSPMPGTGIRPDIPVTPTAASIAANTDPEQTAALALSNSK